MLLLSSPKVASGSALRSKLTDWWLDWLTQNVHEDETVTCATGLITIVTARWMAKIST